MTDGCKLIETFEGMKVTQIAAGGWHSLVLESGNVYAFGWNESGQLGVESADLKTSGIVDLPTLVNLPTDLNFIMLSCGSRHSMAVSSEGMNIFVDQLRLLIIIIKFQRLLLYLGIQ